jgi:hypothetical protein
MEICKFTVIWTPTASWLFEYGESPNILYEKCQRMRIETVYTKTHIQLKIIILDITVPLRLQLCFHKFMTCVALKRSSCYVKVLKLENPTFLGILQIDTDI